MILYELVEDEQHPAYRGFWDLSASAGTAQTDDDNCLH